jgi:hypothetical protein
MVESQGTADRSRSKRAGQIFVGTLEWLLKAGSAFAIYLAIAAAFHI